MALARPSRDDVGLLSLAVLLVVIVVWAVPRTIGPGDAGELATVMLRGGIPHPSGYPWMRLLGVPAAAFESLGMAPATAAALPCALAGAAAWLVLQPLLCRIGGAVVGTFVAALSCCASIVVLHANDCEVWGLHLLLSAIVIRVGCGRRGGDGPRPVEPVRMGLVLGLAVSHHLTAVLLVPLAIGATWPPRADGESVGAWIPRLLSVAARGVLGSALGLLVFVTLMIGDGGPWRWGDPSTLAGLLHHVTRGDYGILQLSLHTEAVTATDQWLRTFGSLGRVLTAGLVSHPAVGGLLLLAIGTLAARARPRAIARGPWWGLLGAAILTAIAFPALHDIDPSSPFGAWILERFDLLSVLVLAPLTVAAIAALRPEPPRRGLTALGVVLGFVLGFVLVIAQLVATARRGVPSDDAFVQRYAVDLLRTPSPEARALVFGTDDHRTFPVLFAHAVLGEGQRVVYVDASLLAHPWYRAQLRRQWPELPDVDKPLRLMAAIWSDPTLASTPIYLANVFSRPAAGLDRVPEGILWRVVPPGSPSPLPAEVVARHRAAFARYAQQTAVPTPLPAHPFTDDLAAHYNEPRARLVEALVAAGMTDLLPAEPNPSP